MRLICVALLGWIAAWAVPVRAAGNPCAGRPLAVQQVVCASPALQRMDAAIRALEGAGAHAADRRDGVLWRADRDDVLWTMMRRGSGHAQVVRQAWTLTRSRMDYLLGRRGLGPVPNDPLQRLVQAMHMRAPGADADVLDAWVRVDPAVKLASEPQRIFHATPAGVFAALALRPDADLSARVEGLAEMAPNLTVHWLGPARIGTVEAVQGTADCSSRVWFRADADGSAHAVATPMLEQSPCSAYGERMALLRGGNDTYAALQQASGADSVDVSLQWWTGERWASPQRVRIRFDHTLAMTRLRCGGGDCAAYRDVVMRLARRYDGSPQAGRLSAIGGADAEAAQRLPRQARAAQSEVLNTVPFADGLAMDRFCDEATYFTVRVDGRLLLGRIGHGHLGWRADPGWLVGLWAERDGRWQPVAGAVVARTRSRVLGAASMPPAVVPTH